jgi:hypothetical protein
MMEMEEINKNRPQLYGLLSIGTKENPQRVGKIALWKHEVPQGTNRPPFEGRVELDGKKYYVAVWQNGESK